MSLGSKLKSISVAQGGDKLAAARCSPLSLSHLAPRSQVRVNTILHETHGGAYKAVCFVP